MKLVYSKQQKYIIYNENIAIAIILQSQLQLFHWFGILWQQPNKSAQFPRTKFQTATYTADGFYSIKQKLNEFDFLFSSEILK